MSNDALDLAFARHVRTIGLITPDQVNAALAAQSKSLQEGKPISVAEALVQLGLLTPPQKESLEKKVKDQQAGVTQLGPYKLVKKIGEGGMGAVYLATDPASGRSVAVKVLPRHYGANAEFVKRFKREADAATKLRHPNIIGAFATGEDQGYHYYVMEYCDGQPLDQLLVLEKRLAVDRAVGLALQAARGLRYAHDQGIIHRDIKPSNIFITRDGTAKILDLGLSKDIGDSALSFKTVTGAVLGTPHYISPEQAQGEKDVDGRTDIYSLGATLYHLLTGRTPFEGATALEILSKHVNTVLPNPQDLREEIPDPVVHILERMMAKEPRDRYRDCGMLIADLEEVTSGRTPKSQMIAPGLTTIAPSAKRSTVRKRPSTLRRMAAARKSKGPLIASIALAAAALVILAVVLSGNSEPERLPERPPPSGVLPPKNPDPLKGSFDVATWEKSVAELPPESQLRLVIARLKDLNSGYDGSERHETGHGGITRIELAHVALHDLSPLRALRGLSQLHLSGTSVTDLSPLKDMKIASLTCLGMKSADLRSIRIMKDLKILSLKSTPLRELTPLGGMELLELNLQGTSLADLSPLRQMKLRQLLCDFDPKRDTETLRSMAALEKINDLLVEDFWRKEKGGDAPTPAPSGPEEQLRSALALLKQLNPDFDGRESHEVHDGAVSELTISALGLLDLAPLASLPGLRKLDVSGFWDAGEKREYKSWLKDLGPLRGMKLESLSVHHTLVWDLEPLRGMKLSSLDVSSSDIKDLSPLRGMPLRKLEISYTHARDLSALAGMPLAELRFMRSEVSDFSLLKSLPVRDLVADLDPQKDRAFLASHKTLELVNGIPIAEFLKAAVAPPAAPPKPAPPPPPEAGPWKNALDLIALIDPQRDSVRGNWRKENGRIISDFPENGVLRIPYEPPPEYDFKIVYSRVGARCATAQFLQREGRGFFWEMGGWGNVNSGFSLVGGRGSKENPTKAPFIPRDGVKYTSVIQVRRDRVTALLDDKKISEWVPSMGEITTDAGWCVDVPNLIGLGNCEALTTFEVVQVREVTGKGRIRTSLTTPVDPAFVSSVPRLSPAEQVKRVMEKLRELNPGFDGESRNRSEGDRVVELEVSTRRIRDLWPVRALLSLKKLELGDEKSVLADIACLKGLKLQELGLSNTRVVDLAPLQGMPLQRLQITGAPVRDLSPLRALPLVSLDCDRISTTDFSVLKNLRSLKTVNDQPTAEFLKNLRDTWTPIFDGRTLDCLRKASGWKIDKGMIASDSSEQNAAQTNFEFDNGDLRIRFEVRGVDSCAFRARQSDAGACSLFFDGVQSRQLEGKPHELVFSCRGIQVTATLDGKALALTEVKPVRSGCLQFNATSGILRIAAIDFRAVP
jgi:serine/threonine protein kinase